MTKWQIRTSIMLILLTLLLLIPTTVYAWVVYVEKKSVATFESGDISITINANQQPFLANIALNDLSYIDFNYDLIANSTQTVDFMASRIKLDLVVGAQSIAVKNRLTFTQLDDGLLYLIIIEGINLGPSHICNANYHDIILSIVDGLSTEQERRDAILAYNQMVLNDIFETFLYAGDTLTIQMVFWGDYLFTENIETTFELGLSIDTIQIRGELT